MDDRAIKKANGGISYSGDFSTPDYYQVYNALPNAGFAGQFVQRMFPNPSTTGAYDAYMKQLASNVSSPPPMQPYLASARPVVDPVVAPFAAATPPASMMPTNNVNLAQFNSAPNAQQLALAPPKMVQPETMAHGGEVDAALHAVRHHLAGGGFLSDLFSGPDYLSTGEVASPTNWGDPEVASDFFKADRALRLAREVQAPMTSSVPDRAPLTAPRPGPVEVQELPVNIPFAAPDRGVSMLSSDISPASVTSLPLAYSPEAPAAPAAAAIDAATGKMTARMPDEPHGTALTKQQADYVIRTIAAETSGKSPEETQAIASVILNRINSGRYGDSPEAVLFAKRQFEPWMNPAGKNYPMNISPKSQRYSDARDALEAAMAGEDITRGATNFWGPKSQYSLGRDTPDWAVKMPDYTDIGATRFHRPNKRAEGGEVDGYDKGGIIKKALGVLAGSAPSKVVTDPAERAANLAKAMSRSAIKNTETNEPLRLYHATTQPNLEALKAGGFDPTISGEATWLSPYADKQPAWHNTRGGDNYREGSNVMPVYADIQTPLVLDTPEMIDWAQTAFAGGSREFPQYLLPEWRKALVDEGYDGIIYGGPKSKEYALHDLQIGQQPHRDEEILSLFPERQLKSATGNSGEFNMEIPRLSEAHGGLVDDALHVVRERHADGEAVGPVATDNSERVRAAESAANLAKQIQAYEASMASIRQQPQDIQSMTHAPEKPRAPISVEALGKNREFGSAPYDVAGPLSTLAQGAYDLKTAPLYAFPPTAPLGMAIDTAEGVASGSPTQVAMGALGGPLKIARNVIAPLAVATGVTAPDEAEAGSLERALRMIRAYHGSPHKFDRFDMSKIGTGEGAQTFGHGLYFAENENVAKNYRDMLAHKGVIDLEQAAHERGLPLSRDAQRMIMTQAGTEADPLIAAKWAQSGSSEMRPYDREKIADLIDAYRQSKGGHMYEVNIDAHPDQLLDWDKPLTAQSSDVRKALSNIDLVRANNEAHANYNDALMRALTTDANVNLPPQPRDYTGDTLHQKLFHVARKDLEGQGGAKAYQKLVAERLNDVGVPGIKYLDKGSRNLTGDLTHNYVIFDDKLIDINRRYAEGGQIPEGNDMRDHFESGGLKLVNKIANKRAKIGHNNPPSRIFPEVAERYPLTKEPVEAFDKNKGEYYLAKDLTPEALAIQKARKAALASVAKGDYVPFFDPAQRFDVDPTKYPNYTPTTSVLTKQPATQAKYDAIAGSPEASTRLDEAYARGLQQQKAAENWYFMGQLEQEFIKEYGPDLGRQMFKQRFADPMAATTGGADPTSNLMMAHYGNYLKEQGLPVPEHSYEYPFPIGGRYAAGNMKQYDKMIMQGQGITHDNPKRYNFSYDFMGKKGPTIDEQMSQMFDPKMNMPPAGTYGHYENALANRAANAGVDPRYFQEVAWAGKKDADSKTGFKAQPMIGIVNEAIERTHQITGMPRDEIVRRGLVRAEIPLYGAAGATAAGAMGPEFMQGQGEATALEAAEAPMTEERKRGGSIVDRALMLVSR